jgi:hypothetical protein
MDRQTGALSAPIILGIMIATFAIIVLRRPDIITNAQPWAEDGHVWLAGIYNDGFWSSVILPLNGYYQTISRVTYGIALTFGIQNAALVANIIAILIRCCFVVFILSKRMNFIDFKYRLAAALYFVLMPNVAEGYVNITNAHWYLSMYLLADVMAKEPESKPAKAHDLFIVFLSGLSGPFVVFIAPCLLIKRWYQRGGIINAIKGINFFDICMAICCLIQVVTILGSSDVARATAPLGYSFGLLADIISERVIFGLFLSFDDAKNMASHGNMNIALFVALCAALIVAFLKSGWRVKSLILFPVLMIGFALAKPVIANDQPQWPLVFNTESGERYFYVTNIALACLALGLVSKMGNYSKYVLFAGVLIFISLTPHYFKVSKFPDVGYKADIAKFQNLAKGEELKIRILPPGWTMDLIKK